ncbi:hypothetical protein FWF93_00210 [Candidatus Saccharibacteria bacterium]|jgi:phosphoribosylglycinamide formyltransferase-1|nr:hypothetical protein [Candidatus Saccharibacteria bacterium]
MELKKVVALASGKGSSVKNLIEYNRKLRNRTWEVVAVVTNKRDAGVIEVAKQFGVECIIIEGNDSVLDDKLVKIFDDIKPDLIVLAGWLRKIGAKVLVKWEGFMINIHPGPTPETAGLYGLGVHRKVRELKLAYTAINIHFVDSGYDTGNKIVSYPIPIPAMLKVFVGTEKAAEDLAQYVLGFEHKLLPLVVDYLMRGEVSVDNGGLTTIVCDGQEVIKQSRLVNDPWTA